MKKVILASLFISILLLSCESLTENNAINEIDKRIVGVWYNTAPTNLENGPKLSYNGIEITEDGTVYDLGINLRTGSFDYLLTENNKEKITRKILFAKKNKIKYESYSYQPSFPNTTTSNSEYALDDEALFIFSNKYYKTELSKKIIQPTTSNFSITLTDNNVTDYKLTASSVVNYPNVFAFKNANSLSIKSMLNDTYFIDITLNNFTGVGEYNEENIDIAVSILQDDMVLVSDKNDYNFSVLLNITGYNESNNLTGTLDFTMKPKNDSQYLSILKFNNGKFTIPIY